MDNFNPIWVILPGRLQLSKPSYLPCSIFFRWSQVWVMVGKLMKCQETMVCTVCLSIFLWICDMARLLHGTIVSWWYLPPIWSSVTDMQHYYHARYPTDDWHLAYMFSLVYFSVEVCLVGVFPHSVSTRQDPCIRVCAPHMLASPLTRKQNRTGGWPSSTWAKWGGIWTDKWVCLQYWVVIWVAGYFNFLLYCTVYGVCHRQDTL